MDSSSSSKRCRYNNNAFEGIAPSSVSDACLQSPYYPPYDVFINHRGPDTKHTLAALIYKHLSAFDLRVFLDQKEIQAGDFLPATIQAALDTCKVHVAIFSPTYAESPWCLAELSHMLTTGATILPIFYDVDPFHLRHIHKGLYAQAFQEHQEKQRIDPGIVQKWKKDLYAVSFISGIVFNTSKEDEAILLKRIVDRVVEETRGEVLAVAKHPVGLDGAFQAFKKTIPKSAKLVGLVGMGGAGKTTLAKKIFNERSSEYKGWCCFLSDVRLEANKSGGLTSLQSRVLQKLLHYDLKIDSTSQGTEMMRSRLENRKVLLILDDVDNMDQIDALLAAKDVLDPGSLVILTSRDKGVLLSSGVTIFHEVKGLRESHARELFCWHAFLLPSPLKDFEALVDKFLISCSGLPLSLKVIGALLYNRDLCHWNGILEKVGKHILPGDIIGTLKVSFDALDREEKEIFLDIACFFAGEEKSKLIRIWDGSGWSGMQSIENLEQKCLIEFVHTNQGYEGRGEDRVLIRMHDHLRDMGRSVIDNQIQPNRLWRADDIGKYLSQIQHGIVMNIRGICGSPATRFRSELGRQSTWKEGWKRFLEICGDATGSSSSSCSFVAAEALRLLQAEGESVITQFNYLSRHLIWLRLDDCCDANALSQLCVPKLRILELINGNCNLNTLWQGQNQAPTQLHELYVCRYGSPSMELPKSIGLLRNLEKIVLENVDIETLPDEMCQLRLLNHLGLRDCGLLQSLPSSFGNLTNLRHLDLFGCLRLQALPNSFSQLIQLQYLSLSGNETLKVSTDILRNIVTLEYLYLSSQTLPTHITNQRRLRSLLIHCLHLSELPVDMDNLLNLRALGVAGAYTMTELPSSLTSLTSLKSLNLSNCPRLQCLPESIAQLQALEYLDLISTGIKVLPQGVAYLRNLVDLHVYSCPLGDIMLCNPRDKETTSCLGNPSLAKAMIRLQSIHLSYTETTKLCIATDVCPNLETLKIADCTRLIQIEALPIKLVHLEFVRCPTLKTLKGIQNLTRLRHFAVSDCFGLQELGDLSELRSLEVLKEGGCSMLIKMQGLQQLQQLKHVEFAVCNAGVWTWIKCLKELPSEVPRITLNVDESVGAILLGILNSLRFPITVLDFQFGSMLDFHFGGLYKVESSHVRSCSERIIIHLCDRSESDGLCRPSPMRCCLWDGWKVLLKDKEELKMREIWEKLISEAYSKRAFRDEGHTGK